MFYQVEPMISGLTRIWDVARTAMYLVEGADRALLIDTGVGIVGLKELVSELTDKPLTVVLTHGHVDHAMGAGAFEEVHISPLDEKVYAEHRNPVVRRGYVEGAAMQGGSPTAIASLTDNDFLDTPEFCRFLPIAPGDRFDLGGVSVEVLEGAGHTPGSLTFLLVEWRILLLGDACNQFTFLFDQYTSPVACYRQMLLGLKEKTDGRYDRVLFSHGMGEGGTGMIDNVIAVCDEILSGHADDVPFQSLLGSGVIAKAMDFSRFCRADGGEGNIVYDPKRLH